MPLRDHFRPPVSKRGSWEGLLGMWPGEIVQHFRKTLPPGFTAAPIVRHPIDPDEEDEYFVNVYDAEGERTLVAVIEIVSPANKDRPEKRNSFVAKCAALLRQGVCVYVVDLVTIRNFNLYTELMTFIGQGRADPMSENPPATYAASCRWGPRGEKTRLETWSRVMTVGQPLPSLPLWLRPDLAITLDLEATYEQACHDLWIE